MSLISTVWATFTFVSHIKFFCAVWIDIKVKSKWYGWHGSYLLVLRFPLFFPHKTNKKTSLPLDLSPYGLCCCILMASFDLVSVLGISRNWNLGLEAWWNSDLFCEARTGAGLEGAVLSRRPSISLWWECSNPSALNSVPQHRQQVTPERWRALLQASV